MSKTDAQPESALIEKLKGQKNAKTGLDSTVLPVSGVEVTWPKFKPHSAWMKSLRLAKNDFTKATNFYIVELCRFDGERMTVAEFTDLFESTDIFHINNEVMGGADDDALSDEDLGNAPLN